MHKSPAERRGFLFVHLINNGMRIFEIDTSIPYHKELSPVLWDGGELKPDIKDALVEIAKLFFDSLKVPNLVVSDIIITGSLANYNWSKYSDIDLHLEVDFGSIGIDPEIMKEYFNAKKNVWNKDHDIKIGGHDVELYVQDQNEEHHSSGIYSVLNDHWVVEPTYDKPDVDRKLIKSKVRSIIKFIDMVDGVCGDLAEIERLKTKIKNMRQDGLRATGEFSNENLVYKILRNNGYIDSLYEKYNAAIDSCYSV